MSLLWTIPPVAVAGGTLMVLAQLRGMAEATSDLQREIHRFREVHLAVAEARSACADARAAARGLRRA